MSEKPTYEELEQKNAFLEKRLAELKKADKKRRKSEKKYRALYKLMRLMIDNVPDLIWAKDLEERHLIVNQADCDKLLCCSSTSEPVGKTHLYFAERERAKGVEYTFGEICENSDEIVKETMRSGRFLEDGMIRGQYLALDVHKAPFYNESGEMIGIVGCGRDVTGEIIAQRSLEDSERRFRELIEDISGISIQGYDENRKVIFWNHASEKIYGYTEAEALGKKLEDLIIPPKMRDQVKAHHSRWIEYGEKIPPGELILIDKYGNDVPVFSSHIMYESRLGKEMFCVDIDLSPIKQAEEEKKQLQDQLRQARKMEAIGTLVGGIAHEFNNMLGVIIGSTELAAEELPERHPARGFLDDAMAASHRAKNTVLKLLAAAQKVPASRKPVRIQAVIRDTLDGIERSLPADIEIRRKFHCDAETISADPAEIRRVLINLCNNSADAIGAAPGVLEITLEPMPPDHPLPARYGTLPAGDYVRLIVADTGHGMSPRIRERIFDPYFTTRGLSEKLGMGMALVYGIVRKYDGAIYVKSDVGKGASVEVVFPRIEVQPQTGPADKDGAPGGSERILLVNEEAFLVKMVKMMLERCGYNVVGKSECPEALSLFREKNDQFDLVIADMTMSDPPGDQLAREIKRIRPDIPLILCVGHNERMDEMKAKKIGVQAFVSKPFSKDVIARIVRKVLDEAEAPAWEGI